MKYRLKFFLISLILLINIIPTKNYVFAEENNKTVSETLAVSFVIDNSGSMNDTDPQKLRETAANIFIDLLSPEDYLGVITFNTEATTVWPINKIANSENKEQIKHSLSPNMVSFQDTNYKVALEQANEQLNAVNDQNVRKVIVFLTDGQPDPNRYRVNDPGFLDGYMDSLWDTVKLLSTNKYPVYSIGFSNDIRVDVLERIAYDTGGDFIILPDANSLASSFFQLLSVLKNRKELTNKSQVLNGVAEFEIYIDEFTSQSNIVIIGDRNGSYQYELLSPTGEFVNVSDGEQSFSNYTIITLNKTKNGLTGNWKLRVDGIGNLEVLGCMDLLVKPWIVSPSPSNQYSTDHSIPLEVQVTGGINNLTVNAYLKDDSGTILEKVKLLGENGSYSGTFVGTENPGIYTVEVEVIKEEKVIATSLEQIHIRTLPTLVHDFKRNQEGYRVGEKTIITSSLTILGGFVALLCLFIVVVTLIILTIIVSKGRKRKVKGKILCYKVPEVFDHKHKEIVFNLTKLKKKEVTIGFSNKVKSDLIVPDMDKEYLLKITLKSNGIRKGSLSRVFPKLKKSYEHHLSITMPGIIECNGKVCSSLALYHRMEFRVGDYVFLYTNEKDKKNRNRYEGRNILEGRYEESSSNQ